MHLPDSLRIELDRAFETCSKPQVKSARRALTQRYRKSGKNNSILVETSNEQSEINPSFMTTRWDRLSYMATRMPATYAVCYHVLNQLQMHGQEIISLLDLGAGPGTVLWAASQLFPSLSQITLLEQDRALIQEGAKLFDDSLKQKHISFLYYSVQSAIPFETHDLVTLSYVLGELPLKDLSTIVQAAWQASTTFLVIIEPGTPEGFRRIREARTQLIHEGAFIFAPCPHHFDCPMTKVDWCHFSQRLVRSSLHRQIKESSLPYEDEKYSYVIAAKNPSERPSSRIVRRPKQGSGHFLLDLCTQDGLKRKIISKKTPALYRAARHATWGDPGPEDHE